MTPALTKPSFHLNGSSRSSLREAYAAALDAVRNARTALHASGPNARDYYLQSRGRPGAFQAAAAEHLSRDQRLRAVSLELQELVDHCDSAEGAR